MSAFGPPGPSSDYKTVNVTAVKVAAEKKTKRSVRTARQLKRSKNPVRIYS